MFAFLLTLPLLVKGADISILPNHFNSRPSTEDLFMRMFPNEPFPVFDVESFNAQVSMMTVYDSREANKILLPHIHRLYTHHPQLFKLLDMSLENNDLTLIKLVVDYGRMTTVAEAVVHFVEKGKLRHLSNLPEDLKDAVNSTLPGSFVTAEMEAKMIVATFLSDYPVGHINLERAYQHFPTYCSKVSFLCQLQVFPFEMIAEKFFNASSFDANVFAQVCKDRNIDLASLDTAKQAILAAYLNEASDDQLSLAYNHLVVNGSLIATEISEIQSHLKFLNHLRVNYYNWTLANVPLRFWFSLINTNDSRIKLKPGQPVVPDQMIDIDRFVITVHGITIDFIPLPSEMPSMHGLRLRGQRPCLIFTVLLWKKYPLEQVFALYPQLIGAKSAEYRDDVEKHLKGRRRLRFTNE